MSQFLQIITTTDSEQSASGIARHLLGKRLAGCVQVQGPVKSSYWWKGTLEMAEEWSCLIKTSAARYPEVEREIRAVHPYEEPEILAFPVVLGSDSYLAWLSAIVGTASDEE